MENEIEKTLKTLTKDQAAVLYWTCRGFNRVNIGFRLNYSPQKVTDEMAFVYDKLGLLLGITKDTHPQTRRTIFKKHKVCDVLIGLIEGNPDNLNLFPLVNPRAVQEEPPVEELQDQPAIETAPASTWKVQGLSEDYEERQRIWLENWDKKHPHVIARIRLEEKRLADEYWENYEEYWGINDENNEDYYVEDDWDDVDLETPIEVDEEMRRALHEIIEEARATGRLTTMIRHDDGTVTFEGGLLADNVEQPESIQAEVVDPEDYQKQEEEVREEETEEQPAEHDNTSGWWGAGRFESENSVRWWESRRNRIMTVIAILLLLVCLALAVRVSGQFYLTP